MQNILMQSAAGPTPDAIGAEGTVRTAPDCPKPKDASAFAWHVPERPAIGYLARESASGDAASAQPIASSDEVDRWARHAAAANGFGGDSETVALLKPVAADLHEAARSRRSQVLGGMIAARATQMLALVRDAAARWAQLRETWASDAALTALDDHTLRDLGLHRSEIASITAEVSGRAERARARAP